MSASPHVRAAVEARVHKTLTADSTVLTDADYQQLRSDLWFLEAQVPRQFLGLPAGTKTQRVDRDEMLSALRELGLPNLAELVERFIPVTGRTEVLDADGFSSWGVHLEGGDVSELDMDIVDPRRIPASRDGVEALFRIGTFSNEPPSGPLTFGRFERNQTFELRVDGRPLDGKQVDSEAACRAFAAAVLSALERGGRVEILRPGDPTQRIDSLAELQRWWSFRGAEVMKA